VARMVVYRIKDWDRHFENNRTKGLKALSWVPFPNKHDGDGYTELLDHPDGPQHYSAWVTMVQVASKCHPRGTLLRDGKIPHDPPSLARKTHIPAVVFEGAIPRLLSIGWLERIDYDATTSDIPHDAAAPPQDSAPRARAETNGTEQKGREGNRRASDVGAFVVGVDALRDAVDSGKVLALAQRAAKVIPCKQFGDRSLVWKAAILAVCKFGESWFADSVEATKVAYAKENPPHTRRAGYFHGILNNKLRDMKAGDLTCYLRTMPEPPEKQEAEHAPLVQLKKSE
jgi:hypothetical protein